MTFAQSCEEIALLSFEPSVADGFSADNLVFISLPIT